MEFSQEVESKLTDELRILQNELPPFMREFFRATLESTSIKTRVGYAFDLRFFFKYLTGEYGIFRGRNVQEIKIEELELITPYVIDEFLEYVTYYTKVNKSGKKVKYQNKEKGKSRKLASIRAMLKYFYKREKIKSNPGELVETPKIHEKPIVRLEADEIVKLLDEVEFGKKLTGNRKKWHEHTKIRDLAIITLMLGTGVRVSECCGINVKDIDFNVNGVKITRKGGNQVILYFGNEVRDALVNYIDTRNEFKMKYENEEALFLSMKGTRLTARSIQYLVKKYSSLVTTLKNISPHKLRSTYGTELYNKTGDIYLVADVLGHKDVNTTRRHYAEMDDSRRRAAAKYVKLRNN